MTIDDEADLPYGEDFHDEAEAEAWAEAAARKRPWRPQIFDEFVTAVTGLSVPAPRVLELGSGPGFLAEHVLDRCPSVARYTLLDFSEPMLAQSRRRLGRHEARTEFLRADFKSDSWPADARGPFDLVVSLQAVHELRHKRHAPRLYAQIRSLLSPVAELVVCDHLPDSAPTPRHRVLYMSVDENLAVLANAGFRDAEVVWSGHEMALYRARALGERGRPRPAHRATMLRTAMSKTLAILLGLALVWLTAWGIAGYFMSQAGTEKIAQSAHVSTRATRLERGAEVRVEGTIVEGPSAVAPYSQKPCLAAVTVIAVTSSYRDIHNREVRESSHIATRRAGPANIEIAVGDKRIELPLERWSPKHYSSEATEELPPRLGVTPEEIASAKERARGTLGLYRVAESTIDGGTRVFVVGRLEDRDGPLRLEADRVLERIELYPGSQDELVKELSGSGGGLRVAGWILGAGVGPLPLAIIGLVLLVRRRRRSAPSVAAPRE